MRFLKPSKLDGPIDRVLKEMSTVSPGTREYYELLTQLDQLYSTKTSNRKSRVSADTVALVLGNLLGIVIIVAYEQKHVITSRGINFIMKPKTPE